MIREKLWCGKMGSYTSFGVGNEINENFERCSMNRIKNLISDLEWHGVEPSIINALKQKYLGISNQVTNQTRLNNFC